jgi:large subunit ribosomal protein L15
MQIHDITPKTKRIKSRQVGRGGKRGKTSGRGTKGQKARAGRKIRPELRDMIKRIPKLRGRGKSAFKSFAVKPIAINLTALAIFNDGEKVTPTTIMAKGILSSYKGKVQAVKILGTGDISKKVIVSDCEVSESAKAKIVAAGGSIK